MAGKKHTNTHSGGIPGLSQILGLQTFDVVGGKLKVDVEDRSLRGVRAEAEQEFFDAFIDRFRGTTGRQRRGRTRCCQHPGPTLRADARPPGTKGIARVAARAADQAIEQIRNGTVPANTRVDARPHRGRRRGQIGGLPGEAQAAARRWPKTIQSTGIL